MTIWQRKFTIEWNNLRMKSIIKPPHSKVSAMIIATDYSMTSIRLWNVSPERDLHRSGAAIHLKHELFFKVANDLTAESHTDGLMSTWHQNPFHWIELETPAMSTCWRDQRKNCIYWSDIRHHQFVGMSRKHENASSVDDVTRELDVRSDSVATDT